jgi:hypothetical protein
MAKGFSEETSRHRFSENRTSKHLTAESPPSKGKPFFRQHNDYLFQYLFIEGFTMTAKICLAFSVTMFVLSLALIIGSGVIIGTS